MFDIPSGSMTSLLFLNFQAQKHWLNNCDQPPAQLSAPLL
jgi:hypothetical protein